MNKKTPMVITALLAVVIAGGLFLFLERKSSLPEPAPSLSDVNTDEFTGEFPSPEETGQNSTSKPEPADVGRVVDANNKFALDYYSRLKGKAGGNIFFSPFSISAALAMTYEGARGKTAEEMRSVFHFPEDGNLRRTQYAAIFGEINKKDKKYKLNTANALWAQKDYEFLKEYFDVVGKYYGGKAANLDFIKDAEGSRITINNWVEARTNNKIKDLIPPGILDDSTRLVLTNAIYFKGEWAKPFNKEITGKEKFRISKKRSVKAQMMRMDATESFNYAENNTLQMLEMPYCGDELSMLLLLPKNDDLAALESSLSVQKLSEWKNNLEEQDVRVFIPKFKFETKYLMAKDLQAMGMPAPFEWPGADFSGMNGTNELYISEVIHQAFVEVNEEGTEAAAATAVFMRAGSAPQIKIPVIFNADHPFIFLIQEKYSGNILFLGRVIEPAQADD